VATGGWQASAQASGGRVDEELDVAASPQSSIERAFDLLYALDGERPMGVTEVARSAGLPKSTAHRLLAILERRGFVTRTDQKYTLGLALFELGSSVRIWPSADLRETSQAVLHELWQVTRETVHLAVLVDGEVMYLEKLYGESGLSVPSRVGTRLPAHCTGLGKALLAYSSTTAIRGVLARGLEPHTGHTLVRTRLFLEDLRRIRGCGIAFDREEMKVGLACVAAPVLDPAGKAVAAISISGRPARVERHAHALRNAALDLGRGLAGAHQSRSAPL
jgi:DNA-binding IclR family transcriptional regulator